MPFYYAFTWIPGIDNDGYEARYWDEAVLGVVDELDCKIRFSLDPTGDVTDEGYQSLRYLFEAPNETAFQTFLTETNSLEMVVWSEISEDDYLTDIVRVMYPDMPAINKFSRPIGSLDRRIGPTTSVWNKFLREKLEKDTPQYFGYELLIPIPDQTKKREYQSWDDPAWHLPVMEISRDAIGSLDEIGCTLRAGNFSKTSDGYHQVRLVVRVFSEHDLMHLAERANLALKDWFPVPAHEYLKGTRLSENYFHSPSLKAFNDALEKASIEWTRSFR